MVDQETPPFTLRVLGGFQLSRSGAPLDIPNRKLACLLTYLACVAPLPQSREKLANLFWSEHPEERARHNLRQGLSRLRALLGREAILSIGDAVLLAPGAFQCDAARFDALLRENTAPSRAAAVDLYGGALLDDVSVSDAAWQTWLLRERARLSERAVAAFVDQGERELASGNALRAIDYGQRATAIDNFREDAHRLVVKSLSAAGRNSEALRRYQDLAALLKAELGAEPDIETRSLVEGLGRGRTSPGPAETDRRQADASRSDASRETARTDPGAGDANPGSPKPRAAGRAVRLDGAERRQVTMLVCSAGPAAEHPAPADPEDFRTLALAFREAAAEVVVSFGGVIIAGPGHCVHACFGHPNVRDHDAAQATRAGIAIVEAVQGLGVASGTPLQASVGIAAGRVVIEAGFDPGAERAAVMIGEAPALAQHLQAFAAPGEVMVSSETRPLLEGQFEMRPSGEIGARGTAPPLSAWIVAGELDDTAGPSWRREALRAPPFGRQEEVDLLLRRWEHVKQGDGRVVVLSGEPGIGKSYIAEHLMAALDAEGPAHLRYFCSPHHAMRPLHPYIRQVERSAGLASAATPVEKRDRLAALVGPTSADVSRDVALLAELLALPADERYPTRAESPQQKRELVMTAYLEILAGLAAQRPVVILFEDIHWIDPTSFDLLDRTISRIAGLPVLLIATCRPEHQPAWVGEPHVTLLHLNRLGRADCIAIIGDVAGERAAAPPIVDQILDRTDGVPLFVRELSKHLVESGLLDDMGGDGRRPLPPLSIPAALQAALSVRLEGLGAAKSLALIGSVIGRRFSRQLIAAAVEPDFPGLDDALQRLTASGLVSRRGAPPNTSYVFTHALTRDAAYDLLLKDQRRQLHARIADALLDRFRDDPEGLPEVVAHHFSQAGRTAEAAEAWVAASRSARARWANRECADFLELALSAVDALPKTPETLRQGVDLRFELKNALTPLGLFDRIIDSLREAEGLIDQLDDRQRLCQLQVHMCQVLGLGGKAGEAIPFGQEAERLARSLGDPRLLVEATIFLATAHFTVTDYQEAERLFLRVLRLLEDVPSGERFALAGAPQITARMFLTGTNAVRGKFEEGIRYGEAALRQAEALQQPYSLGLSMWCLANLHLTRGDVAQAIVLLQRGLEVARQWDLPILTAAHGGSLGYAYALTSRTDEGLPLLEQALRDFETMRHQFGLSLFRVPLGEAYVLGGRFDEAGDVARVALKLARESGQRGDEAGSLHVLADVAARAGDLDQAEIQYRHALALAEELGMRPLAARCRHGLATIYAGKADPETASADRAAATAMYRDMGMALWLDQLHVRA